MAVTGTTLSSAANIDQNFIVVASATGFAAGSWVKCEGEFMQVRQTYASGTTIPVGRGKQGTANQALAAGAPVVVGTGSDFGDLPAGAVVNFPLVGRATETRSYGADGAITLPKGGGSMTAILTKATAAAMTLADPTKDMDGAVLEIVSTTKVAHTITSAGGFGGNTTNTDVLTMNSATGQTVRFVASNAMWLVLGSVSGSATVAAPGLA